MLPCLLFKSCTYTLLQCESMLMFKTCFNFFFKEEGQMHMNSCQHSASNSWITLYTESRVGLWTQQRCFFILLYWLHTTIAVLQTTAQDPVHKYIFVTFQPLSEANVAHIWGVGKLVWFIQLSVWKQGQIPHGASDP